MSTYPLPSLAASVSTAGITAPSYSDIVTSLQASFKAIYGTDVYLGNDTQDGQLLAIFARAMSDANSAAIAAYQQFSPITAQGAALSNLVKINGIARLVSSRSTVDLLIGGAIGTVINNGAAVDSNGISWALPSQVVIPNSGQITVNATATTVGEIDAAAGLITIIGTPTLGWQSVSNPAAAVAGAPVETDAQLRIRQTQSVGLPASTVLVAALAAVKAVPNVIEAVIYENDTNDFDSNGLPPHSISVVASGGDPQAIGQAIADKKTPGCYTYGDTSIYLVDAAGAPHQIRFFRPQSIGVSVAVVIKALPGYVGGTGAALRQAIVDYINNTLGIGQQVTLARVYLPAQLNGDVASAQYNVTALNVYIDSSPFALLGNIPFNGQAVTTLDRVTLTVQ